MKVLPPLPPLARIVPRTTPSVVVAGLALVVACAGSATAGALITGAQIKDDSVTHHDVKDGTLLARDMAVGTVRALRGSTGPQGPKGATGATGPAGITDWTYSTNGVAVAANQGGSLDLFCPAGSRLLSASGYWGFTSQPASAIPLGPTSARITGQTKIADNLIGFIVCAKGL